MNVLWNNKLLKLNLSLINSKVKDNHEITTQKQKRIFLFHRDLTPGTKSHCATNKLPFITRLFGLQEFPPTLSFCF